MAVQNPFFGRRDSSSNNNSSAPGNQPASSDGPATRQATGVLGSAASRSAASAGGALPASLAATAAASGASAASASGGSKLTVGPNIKLKGVEITDCDTLVVEGTVEATMDSRVIHIAEQGAFSGSADIDIAEIHGAFDGKLTVRQKLVIHSTGRVTGTVRYGRLVIEDGGQLAGDVALGGNAPVQAALLAA